MLIVTHTHTHSGVCSVVSPCCSSAWSVEQRVEECSPGMVQLGEKSRRSVTHMAVSPHLYLSGQ